MQPPVNAEPKSGGGKILLACVAIVLGVIILATISVAYRNMRRNQELEQARIEAARLLAENERARAKREAEERKAEELERQRLESQALMDKYIVLAENLAALQREINDILNGTKYEGFSAKNVTYRDTRPEVVDESAAGKRFADDDGIRAGIREVESRIANLRRRLEGLEECYAKFSAGGGGSNPGGTCASCGGKGKRIVEVECETCRGRGNVSAKKLCKACKGKGVLVRNAKCPKCGGDGSLPTYDSCGECGGKGGEYVMPFKRGLDGKNMAMRKQFVKCKRCGGLGRVKSGSNPCSTCSGSGTVKYSSVCLACSKGGGRVPCPEKGCRDGLVKKEVECEDCGGTGRKQ